MSKWTALLCSFLCAMSSVAGYYANAPGLILATLAIAAVIFLGTFFDKLQRDMNIHTQARLERNSRKPTQPPMISEGSRRLFVPKPLND